MLNNLGRNTFYLLNLELGELDMSLYIHLYLKKIQAYNWYSLWSMVLSNLSKIHYKFDSSNLKSFRNLQRGNYIDIDSLFKTVRFYKMYILWLMVLNIRSNPYGIACKFDLLRLHKIEISKINYKCLIF